MWSSLDWARINALYRHWQREPPIAQSAFYLARFFGAESKGAPATEPKTQSQAAKDKSFADSVDELRKMFPGGMIR